MKSSFFFVDKEGFMVKVGDLMRKWGNCPTLYHHSRGRKDIGKQKLIKTLYGDGMEMKCTIYCRKKKRNR